MADGCDSALKSQLCSYIRQFGDLDQSLEVHHISSFIEEGLQAAGQRTWSYSANHLTSTYKDTQAPSDVFHYIFP